MKPPTRTLGIVPPCLPASVFMVLLPLLETFGTAGQCFLRPPTLSSQVYLHVAAAEMISVQDGCGHHIFSENDYRLSPT